MYSGPALNDGTILCARKRVTLLRALIIYCVQFTLFMRPVVFGMACEFFLLTATKKGKLVFLMS